MAVRIRARLGGIPFPPTFAFWPWLIGLLVVTAGLLALTPLAYQSRGWLRPLAWGVGAINVGNALLHLVASAVARRRVPGVLSSSFLLMAALWLLYAA